MKLTNELPSTTVPVLDISKPLSVPVRGLPKSDYDRTGYRHN